MRINTTQWHTTQHNHDIFCLFLWWPCLNNLIYVADVCYIYVIESNIYFTAVVWNFLANKEYYPYHRHHNNTLIFHLIKLKLNSCSIILNDESQLHYAFNSFFFFNLCKKYLIWLKTRKTIISSQQKCGSRLYGADMQISD